MNEAKAATRSVLGELQLFSALDGAALEVLADAVESMHLRGGDTLMHEGEKADALYVVVSGRLRAFVDAEGGEQPVGDISAGEVVGEMALLSHSPRSATVRAVRDCHLLRLSDADFEKAVHSNPSTLIETARVIVARLERSIHGHTPPPTPRAIAVLPAGDGIDHQAFAKDLANALGGRTVLVDRQTRDDHAGENDPTEAELAAWLYDTELRSDAVVYASEPGASPWTHRCIRQADRILLVGARAGNPALNDVEQELLASRGKTTARIDLVLLHPQGAPPPSGTAKWLDRRDVVRHHHVRGADIRALVRNLTGTELALVLSGGGARGMAHIGVIRALGEAGVPIDLIGGTSFGALVAGWHAIGLDWNEIRNAANHYLVALGQPIDVTVPVAALTSSKKVSDRVHRSLGEAFIEDLWRPAFAVSANLTRGEVQLHRRGSLWKAVRSSIAIPGVFAPVRSETGDVLVDGGIMDNLPIAIMRGLQDGGPLVAVDLKAAVSMPADDLPTHGHLSGLRLLWQRINPFADNPRTPSIADILLRATETGSVLNAKAQIPLAEYLLRPDVGDFGLLQWSGLDDLIEIGYRHTIQELETWAGEGRGLPWRSVR
jgi:predicted acylesterase/phospholipase RssA